MQEYSSNLNKKRQLSRGRIEQSTAKKNTGNAQYKSKNVPLVVSELTNDQINAALMRGYKDVLNNRVKPAATVFAEFKRDQ
jgi:hypothetical protein